MDYIGGDEVDLGLAVFEVGVEFWSLGFYGGQYVLSKTGKALAKLCYTRYITFNSVAQNLRR